MSCPIRYLRMVQKRIGNRRKLWNDEKRFKSYQRLLGRIFEKLASEYEVTVFKGEKKNKGWAGHVLERHLELPINSAQAP